MRTGRELSRRSGGGTRVWGRREGSKQATETKGSSIEHIAQRRTQDAERTLAQAHAT